MEGKIHRLTTIIMTVMLAATFFVPAAAAEGMSSLANAFFLTDLPASYADQERFIDRLKDGGANTVVIRAPFNNGILDRTSLTNVVFLAHRGGMKLFVVLPTRGNSILLAQHPEWEDLRYDLRSGSVVRSGRIDLFQPEAIGAIASTAKDIASFSVDGILLAEDFSYRATEGMSPRALQTYRQIFGSDFSARNVWSGITQEDQAVKLGGNFWNLADLKKNTLVNQFRSIAKAAWSVQPKIKLGLPLPVDGLMTPKDVLAQFSHDLDRFRKLNIDYYWVDIRHRDLRTQQGMSYAKSMEAVARIAKTATSLLNDGERLIMTVQTQDPGAKLLPLSEVDEAVSMITHSGRTGIALLVSANTPLPASLTRKVFNRE